MRRRRILPNGAWGWCASSRRAGSFPLGHHTNRPFDRRFWASQNPAEFEHSNFWISVAYLGPTAGPPHRRSAARLATAGCAPSAKEYMARKLARSGTAGRVRAEDALDSRITILVYDYAGVQADTLRKSEQEARRIFRHSAIDITRRHCWLPGSSIPLECPPPSPMTPAVRLVPQFRLVQDRVHAEAMGYAPGDFATVSVEFAGKLEESGVARLPEILGHIMAHEIGHLLLPGGRHSVSGIMKAQWSLNEWKLVRQGALNFAPEQSRFLQAELLRRLRPVAQEER